jgi:hypothetical protein
MKPSLSCLPNQSWLRSRLHLRILLDGERRTFAQRTRNIYTSAPSRTPARTDMPSTVAILRRLTGGASYPSLRGRSVFITGGGSGIGACLTESFARQGSLVAFVDIAEAPSQALVEKIEGAGLPRPGIRKTDVTDIAALQAPSATRPRPSATSTCSSTTWPATTGTTSWT